MVIDRYLEFNFSSRKIIGTSVAALSFRKQIELILDWAASKQSKVVCVANVHMLVEAFRKPEFASVLRDADLVTPDGMPLVWMLRIMGSRSQERVAGLDIFTSLCKLAEDQKIGIFCLGSEHHILEMMRVRLEREYPKLKISGMEPLPFRPLTETEDAELIAKVNHSGAGIVLVSLGCPKQEYWMNQHRDKLQVVMIGLGGAFPVYAGIQKRAPLWVREAGLEWFYRLLQEPRRLWRRYLVTNTIFTFLALKQLIKLKWFGKAEEPDFLQKTL